MVKASDFDSDMRRFESYIPSQIKRICFLHVRLIFYGGMMILTHYFKSSLHLNRNDQKCRLLFALKNPIRSEPQIGF